MRIHFRDADLRRLYTDRSFRSRKWGSELTRAFRKTMQVIVAAQDERDLYALKSLHFEKLRGNREGQHSLRLGKKWRLIVELEEEDQQTIIN
nr:type II toxin-antitoxin system RelE/ParE family toxin [Actinomycetota bacterium]